MNGQRGHDAVRTGEGDGVPHPRDITRRIGPGDIGPLTSSTKTTDPPLARRACVEHQDRAARSVEIEGGDNPAKLPRR